MGNPSLHTRLADIRDWRERAATASFRAGTLAKNCGVTTRTLRAFFAQKFKKPLKKQLQEFRIHEVMRMLKSGECLKNVAVALGYGNSGNLNRDFKTVYGMTPRRWLDSSGEEREKK